MQTLLIYTDGFKIPARISCNMSVRSLASFIHWRASAFAWCPLNLSIYTDEPRIPRGSIDESKIPARTSCDMNVRSLASFTECSAVASALVAAAAIYTRKSKILRDSIDDSTIPPRTSCDIMVRSFASFTRWSAVALALVASASSSLAPLSSSWVLARAWEGERERGKPPCVPSSSDAARDEQ
jgi:hypothetical protein